MSDAARPVQGPIFAGYVRWALAFAVLGFALTMWRFAVGLGQTTALNDGYPWGLWIAFDVVTGTALACGGYAMALLVYVFNRGRYHALVRPAILTSALGYSVAAVAIVVDVGRPWFIWRIPVSVGQWNLDSALLEVALCVMSYVAVVWIELTPAMLERWRSASRPGLARFAERALPVVERMLLWFVALGLLLPTMHQSSLGSVILLAGSRLHPLWHTPLLPLLFLVSCIAMGYAAVMLENVVSTRVFRLRRDDRLLASMAPLVVWLLGAFVVLRVADIVVQGKAGFLLRADLRAGLFWAETLIAIFAMHLLRGPRPGVVRLWYAALAIAGFGTLYRFDAYLVAFQPSSMYAYFPSVTEILITIGLIGLQVVVYVWLVKRLPILGGGRASPVAP